MRGHANVAGVVLVLWSMGVAAASAGGPGQPLFIPEADHIIATDCDVLQVTVQGVSKHKATRANPPVVDLKIDKVLRGLPRKSQKCMWDCPYDPSFIFPDAPYPTKEDLRLREAFARELMEPPTVGSQWILLGEVAEEQSEELFMADYRYPLSKEKTEWALAEIERCKRLRSERQQYAGQWPESAGLSETILRKEGRPVQADTPLHEGQPILLDLGSGIGQLWRCRVVKALDDGRVHVRMAGHDSRSDRVKTRDRLLLYPEKWLTPPKEFRADDASTTRSVQDPTPEAPAVICTIRSKATCRLGSVPEVTVAIRNHTDTDIYLVGSLDGSADKARYPHCYFEVTGPDGQSTVQEAVREDPFANTLRPEDFVRLRPGESFNPCDPSRRFFPALTSPSSTFAKAQVYRIRFVYSTKSDNIALWRGDDWGKVPAEEKLKILDMFRQVPKVEVKSNEIRVVVVD